MIYSDLSEEELCLFVLFTDETGLDQAEFCMVDERNKQTGLFRAWPVQQFWWRKKSKKIISQGSRSIGKSLSAKLRAFAFPFVHPGGELVITAPEGLHLDALTDNIESLYLRNRIAESMLAKDQRGRIKHRPFHINFANGGRIMARLPKFDGSGVRGTHPDWLIQDESCFPGDTLVLTYEGYKKIEDIQVGEFVLTHKGNWKKVLNVIDNGVREVIKLKGQGHHGLRVTPNHRFWAQEVLDYKDRKNKWGVKKKSDFKWIRAENMLDNLWSTPNNIPYFEIPKNIKASNISTSYDIDILNDDFLWCLGLYIAEGSTSSSYGTGGLLNKTTWSVHSDEVDFVTSKISKAGLHWFVQPVQASDKCKNIVVAHIDLARFMNENCGHGCYDKTIPLWVHALTPVQRSIVYDGLIYGDGCNIKDNRYKEGNQCLATTSKKLAFDFQILSRSIGRTAAITHQAGGQTNAIRGREFVSGPSYDVRSRFNGQGFIEDDKTLFKVKSIEFAGYERVYDLTVEDDHSFVAEGIIVHNSFYPEPAWKELIETLIINDDPEHDNSRWFSHGVTVGPGNTFDDKISGKDSTWEVVPLPAMYRPNWSDKERQDKIIEYGGEDSPDYRRNVKGLSANAGTPLLVMHRLMEAVDSDEMSAYNLEEYSICNINDAQVREVGSILDLFDPPISHTKYGKVWIGMDYGLTTSNSCLVIFAETKEKGDDHGRLRLLSKITLTRIPTEDQVDLIKHIMEIYRPTAFVFDAHGIGQPAYDWLQKEVREDENVAWMLDRIKGYSFSKKMIVQFDPNIEISEDDPDGWKAAAIERLGSEASIDSLRLMVDSHRLRLPYDKDLIGELQAVQRKEPVRFDEYGKPKRKQGQHTLDAIRFALLGYNQHVIEEIVKSYEDSWSPPEMIIMDYI